MTSSNPPYPYFNGITYNPSFFNSSSSSTGLTQTVANTLYLKKTVSDTASALETFSGGIKANSIEPTANNASMDIATTSISGAINIGTALGRTGNINIGLLTGQTTPYNVVIGSSGKSFVTLNGNTVTLNGAVTINGTLSNVDTSTSLLLGTINATDVKISKSGSNTLIGGTLSITSTTTATDTITANGGLTIGGTNNITLGNGTVAPTTGQIGYILTGVLATNANFTNNTPLTVSSIPLTAGTWVLTASYMPTNATTTLTEETLCFSTTTNALQYTIANASIFYTTGTTIVNYQSISGIYSNTSPTTIYLIKRVGMSGNGVSIGTTSTNLIFKAVRIA